MHLLVALCAVLWRATFPVENGATSAGISQAYIAADALIIATRHSIEARSLRDGSRRWSRSGIGLPVETNDGEMLGATQDGVAYVGSNGRVHFRIRPCENAQPPVAVALDTKTGAALCQHKDGLYNFMRAVFFSLASGKILNSAETTMPSRDYPVFGFRLGNDRYGVRAFYGGATLSVENDALDLRNRRVEDSTMGEDESMQLALRGKAFEKFCAHKASPGSEIRSGAYVVETCGGTGGPLSVTVFSP